MKINEIRQTGLPVGAPIQSHANPPNRILVVDDDISIREFSAEVLTASGYQVDTAEDSEAGWEALHASAYDLLITDHNMPKVSGVELVEKVRSAGMTLPVVLASGSISTEALNRNSPLQLTATLHKPFAMDELLEIVRNILGEGEWPSERFVID